MPTAPVLAAVAMLIASLLASPVNAGVNAISDPEQASPITQLSHSRAQLGRQPSRASDTGSANQTGTYHLTLPAQSVADALNSLSEQTDIQVLFPFDLAARHRIKPLEGSYSIQHALALLLQDTGLYGGLTQSGVITISPHASESRTNQNGKGKRMNITKRKTLLATMVGIFAAGGAVGVQAQDDGATAQNKIDEIIVTATKRATSLQDTAMAITALSGETIDKRGLVGMADYLSGVPGVTVNDMGAGQNALIIRGLASNPQADDSLAGIYFGETPMTNLLNFGGRSNGSADIKMVDIDRVEILRGPQGTLYGSSGMSGIVKIIPT
ncbi:TonB-dependent receptor plug domain-containing protein, partial [Porticoccaceae bacterium]|nr:TonB-dependent receptor plug domain-containing protein [Porticoccaceae bacterium]